MFQIYLNQSLDYFSRTSAAILAFTSIILHPSLSAFKLSLPQTVLPSHLSKLNNNINIEENIYRNKMSHSKLKIQFHPRRISASNSKEKYSPYRTKQKRSQNEDIFQQTRQKLNLNEPLIRFRRQIQTTTTKTKLKLAECSQKTPILPSPTCLKQDTWSTAGESCPNCAKLIAKIEQQTAFLKQNFKEINNTLKLPKLSLPQNDCKNTQDHQEHTQNQKIIIAYLDQIRNRKEEGKESFGQLQKENQRLMEKLSEIGSRNKALEQQLVRTKADQKQLFQMLTDRIIISQKSTRSVAISSHLLQLTPRQDQSKQKESLRQEGEVTSGSWRKDQANNSCYRQEIKADRQEIKTIVSELMTRQNCDFEKIMKELKQIKLENDMLREELKLLNYAMTEKDAKIELLKNQLLNFIQKSKRQNSYTKSFKSSIKHNRLSSKKVDIREDISIECIDDSEKKDLTITNKRTNSFLITSRSQLMLAGQPHQVHVKGFEHSYIKMARTLPFRLSADQSKWSRLLQQEDRFTMSKPMLKLKKQETTISKRQKELLEREKKELLCFSQDKLRDLDLVRRTLEHRLKGFKFSFHQLQAEMLNRQDYNITYIEMDQILASYPFSLQPYLRQRALSYVLRQTENLQLKNMSIPSDLFANRLRELMTDYQDIEEQEELLLVQKLKKKVYMHLEGIINECLKLQDQRGLISEEDLKRVLEEFKLSKLEIEMFINQSCLLSLDADHLDYKQYLSIFQNEQ